MKKTSEISQRIFYKSRLSRLSRQQDTNEMKLRERKSFHFQDTLVSQRPFITTRSKFKAHIDNNISTEGSVITFTCCWRSFSTSYPSFSYKSFVIFGHTLRNRFAGILENMQYITINLNISWRRLVFTGCYIIVQCFFVISVRQINNSGWC